MGSGGYIKDYYQNNKYKRYNYDAFIANDTIFEETNEEMNEETNEDIDNNPYELINDVYYQNELYKDFCYLFGKLFVFLNGIISKIFKTKK